MKHNALIATLLSALLVACGPDQPESETAQELPGAEEVSIEPGTDTQAPADAAEAEPEMVEESAGEPETQADDQPIILAQADTSGSAPTIRRAGFRRDDPRCPHIFAVAGHGRHCQPDPEERLSDDRRSVSH